ncbi:hypothetical protein SLS61_001763 [Didymella pomorum]
MSVQPIRPNGDERIQHKTAVLNGFTYHYLYAVPNSGKWIDTVFLIHGWPDLSMGWRYQIPLLVHLGFRVVAPDMMGYGETVTPYTAPHKEYFSTEQLVKGPLPQFAYQLHLASGEVEKSVNDEATIGQFLRGTYGAKGPNGELVFDPEKGIIKENLSKVGESRILNGEVLDYYVKQYSRHGIHPTLNWYRQRLTNWEEDQALLTKKIIHQPVLFIQATYDSVLKPEMSKSMDKLIPNLTRGEVKATHWALTQKPEEVNDLIRRWLEKEGLVKAKSAL